MIELAINEKLGVPPPVPVWTLLWSLWRPWAISSRETERDIALVFFALGGASAGGDRVSSVNQGPFAGRCERKCLGIVVKECVGFES